MKHGTSFYVHFVSTVSIHPLFVNIMSQAPLAPVSLPTDIDLVQTVDRETLRAKLRARTNALASGRLRKQTNAHEKLAQAAHSVGAPAESASATALLHSTSAEKLAEMI